VYHIKEVMCYSAEWKRDYFCCHFPKLFDVLFPNAFLHMSVTLDPFAAG
jgi:hypothetical protein